MQADNDSKIVASSALSILFETVLKTKLNYLQNSCEKENGFQNSFKNNHCIIDNHCI